VAGPESDHAGLRSGRRSARRAYPTASAGSDCGTSRFPSSSQQSERLAQQPSDQGVPVPTGPVLAGEIVPGRA
jgi:hypothetical protein